MRTNARSCMRGWGTVRRSSAIVMSSIEQDVDVDGPRAPADVADAAELGFDAVDGGEEVERLEVGVDLGDDVQEVGLLGAADGIRLPDPGRASHGDAGIGGQQVRRPAWSVASRSPRFEPRPR